MDTSLLIRNLLSKLRYLRRTCGSISSSSFDGKRPREEGLRLQVEKEGADGLELSLEKVLRRDLKSSQYLKKSVNPESSRFVHELPDENFEIKVAIWDKAVGGGIWRSVTGAAVVDEV